MLTRRFRALCRIDAREAESALTDFTLYLRGNLDSLSNTGCIPFLQELQHTKHYVDLEKMRFGRDLTVLFNTPVTQFSPAAAHIGADRRKRGCATA